MAELNDGEMWIGDLVRETGVSSATINFYVKDGILPAPRKISRTRAAYAARHLHLLKLLRRMQQVGYNLAHIKGLFEAFGTDEAGIAKLEGIGRLRDLPPVRGDPERRPLAQFEPVGRAAFLKRTGASKELVDILETWGVLRPRSPGRYGAQDAWLVMTVKSLLDDGVPMEWLEYHRQFLPIAEEMAILLAWFKRRFASQVVARELRVGDFADTLMQLLQLILMRVAEEQHPAYPSRPARTRRR
jgi:DNA-binding transcriptional MerR regulator